MTAEILSIIAVCISGITAICSATIPAILSYKSKKAELQAQKVREVQKRYEAEFDLFYQKHWKIVKDFSTHYDHWKANPQNKNEILEYIEEISTEFRDSLTHWLTVLATKINNYKTGDNLDKDYELCEQLILESYGVRISADTPDYLLSEMLKVVLKERFNELKLATSKDFYFHSR